MSIQFSDTTYRKGLVQIFEKEILANYGDVSGNTDKLKDFTADANTALDRYMEIALKSSGKWQFDDSNHTDYPFIYTNLVSGQRDYTFTTDESGNLILDIYKVMVADNTGIYREILPVDQQELNNPQLNVDSFIDGQNSSGTPTRYDKTANGIFLDVIPNYNYTNGLKVFINREGSYFTYTDTTKMAGVAGTHHRYFAIKPAYDYARRHSLSNVQSLFNEVTMLEREIGEYYARRDRDKRKRFSPSVENCE